MNTKAAPESQRASAPVIAHSFTRARKPLVLRKCACSGSNDSDCGCSDNKKPFVQRSAAGGSSSFSVPSAVHNTLSSPGRPLDTPTRDFMESRFNQDFSSVRIHTGPQAAESAQAVNAHAYTVGQDIVFDQGQYRPETDSGKHLLAHELAHTVQQRGLQKSAIEGTELGANSALEQRLEREADAAANAVTHSGGTAAFHTGFTRARTPLISRQEKRHWGSLGSSLGTSPKTGKPFTRIQIPFEGGTSYVTARSNSKVVDEKGNPTAVAFLVDKLFLPKAKAKHRAAYEALALKGALEATFKLSGNLPSVKPGRPSNMRQLWSQDKKWPDASVCQLWHEAGGSPHKSLGTATFTPGACSTFPRVGKNDLTCEVDHRIELQLGGTNLPANFEMLDSDINNFCGWDFFRNQLELIAKYIRDEILPDKGNPDLILHFAAVEVLDVGPAPGPQPNCSQIAKGGATHCWEVEACVGSVKGFTPTEPAVDPSKPSTPAQEQRFVMSAPTGTAEIIGPLRDKAKNQTIDLWVAKGTFNEPAGGLIPGLKLREFEVLSATKRKQGRDKIKAKVDWGGQTKTATALQALADKDTPIPLTYAGKADKPDPAGRVTESGIVHLASTRQEVKFQYPWLSPVSLFLKQATPGGPVTGKGKLKPSVPFLPTVDIEWEKDSLRVVKGLDEAALKKKSFLGAQITKAEVSLALLPDFKPEGRIEFQIGKGKTPLATGWLKLTTDNVGLVAAGKLNLAIPKIDTAEADIIYRAGEGRNEWEANIKVESSQIKLPYVTSGSLIGQIAKNDMTFAGKVNLTMPGDRGTAEVGLKREKGAWILHGGGKFKVPPLDEATVGISYNTGTETLTAWGKTGFLIKAINLRGEMENLTFVAKKGGEVSVTGTGSLKFKRGKAEGWAKVTLHPNGKFTGKGGVTYQIKENIIVTGEIELDDKQKLTLTGDLTITRYELFKEYGNKKDLLTLDLPVPVPGLSVGTAAGLVFHIRGGISAAYSFGPGTLEPLKFIGRLNPLEDDPNLELRVMATVKVPATATLSAWISGSLALQVDILVGSAGAEGGVKLQGDLILKAGAFANLDAMYKQKRLTAKLVAGIDSKLLLGLTLSAFVRAWAGAFGFSGEVRKDWTLAKKTIDTRLGFYISAPFEYADDTGIKLPALEDITVKKPELTTENMKRILTELFDMTTPTTVEK